MKSKFYLEYKRDEVYYRNAILGHAHYAHGGKVLEGCSACKDLLKKIRNFNIPKVKSRLDKKVSGHTCWYDMGRNPSSSCRSHRHKECCGEHFEKHGIRGAKCTCECHDLQQENDSSEVKRTIHELCSRGLDKILRP